MKENFQIHIWLGLLLCLLGMSCSDDTPAKGDDPGNGNTELEVNEWIESVMRSDYLWNNDIPAQNKLDFSADPQTFFRSMLSLKDGKTRNGKHLYYYSYMEKNKDYKARTSIDADDTYGMEFTLFNVVNDSRACSGGLLGQGCLCDSFRNRKLLEYHLETAALKNDLSTQEALLLLALRQLERPCTRRELADFTGLSRGTLTLSLQRLGGKGLIETETPSDADERCPVLTAESASVLRDLEIALADWQAIRLDGFTQEECVQYHAMMERINGNIQNFLQ